MDELEILDLLPSALRRKRFEYQLMASALSEIATAVMGEMQTTTPVRTRTTSQPTNGRIHADEMLRDMGITIQ